ncbi:hypothetical protein FRC18_005547 [Serendipita sp. 400]|nr:hypothetical protein FRC18_005547 [Serendipita sp. 400]
MPGRGSVPKSHEGVSELFRFVLSSFMPRPQESFPMCSLELPVDRWLALRSVGIRLCFESSKFSIGYGGTCITGNCKPGTLVQTAIVGLSFRDVKNSNRLCKAWYTKNLQISIPVSVVVGLVILIIVSSIIRCLWNCCNRKKSRANAASSIPPNVPGQRLPSWGPGMAQSNNMVTAGPFSFPPQRLNRNGSNGSNEIPRDRRRDSRIDERRPSDSSDNRRDQANANMRPHYPMQPSYERETTRPGNPRRNARNRTEDRLNWVDDRIFNGPRG